MNIQNLRFVIRDGKRILQYQRAALFVDDPEQPWIDVPLEDCEWAP